MNKRGYLIIDVNTVLFWHNELDFNTRLKTYVDSILTHNSKEYDNIEKINSNIEQNQNAKNAEKQNLLNELFPETHLPRAIGDLSAYYLNSKKRSLRTNESLISFIEEIDDEMLAKSLENWNVVLYVNSTDEKEASFIEYVIKAIPAFSGFCLIFNEESLYDVIKNHVKNEQIYVLTSNCEHFASLKVLKSMVGLFTVEKNLIYFQNYSLEAKYHKQNDIGFKQSSAFWTCFSITNIASKLDIIELCNQGHYKLDDLIFVGLYFTPLKFKRAIESRTIDDKYPLVYTYHDPLAEIMPKKLDIVHVRLTNLLEFHEVKSLEEAKQAFNDYLERIRELEKTQNKTVRFINSVEHAEVYISRKGMDDFLISLFETEDYKIGYEDLKTNFKLKITKSIIVNVDNADNVI